MSQQPTAQELQDSIQELSDYRDRLHKEFLEVARKLQMPQNRIMAMIDKHPELIQIEKVISQLKRELNRLKA